MFGGGWSAFLKVFSRLYTIPDSPLFASHPRASLSTENVWASGGKGRVCSGPLPPSVALRQQGGKLMIRFSGNVSKQVLNKVSPIGKRSGFVQQTLLNIPALMELERGKRWAAALVSFSAPNVE